MFRIEDAWVLARDERDGRHLLSGIEICISSMMVFETDSFKH
jgi:hypothetical protein